MGSNKPRNSTRAHKARSGKQSPRRKPARKDDHETHERGTPQPDLDAILGRFSEALSIIATATHTLIGTQDRIDVETPYDASETIFTLKQGLNALRRAYNELDVAIGELS